jgi:hypothetical protein
MCYSLHSVNMCASVRARACGLEALELPRLFIATYEIKHKDTMNKFWYEWA